MPAVEVSASSGLAMRDRKYPAKTIDFLDLNLSVKNPETILNILAEDVTTPSVKPINDLSRCKTLAKYKGKMGTKISCEIPPKKLNRPIKKVLFLI